MCLWIQDTGVTGISPTEKDEELLHPVGAPSGAAASSAQDGSSEVVQVSEEDVTQAPGGGASRLDGGLLGEEHHGGPSRTWSALQGRIMSGLPYSVCDPVPNTGGTRMFKEK